MISSSTLWIFYQIGQSGNTLNHLYDVKTLGKIKKFKQIEGEDLTTDQAIIKEEKKLRELVEKIPKTF